MRRLMPTAKTTLLPANDSLGIKKKLTATPENLRRWYILERDVQELYAAAGIGGGDEVSRECSEKLRHMLELCL